MTNFTDDFDGTGRGNVYSINSAGFNDYQWHPQPQPSYGFDPGAIAFQQFLERRRQQQLMEIQERARQEAEERAREEAERQRRLQNVQRIKGILETMETMENQEPSALRRMQETQEILALEKQFAQARDEYLATFPSYLERLRASLDLVVVPPPSHPLHYNQILILGMAVTPEDVQKAILSKKKDSFTGRIFDEVFAFGVSNDPEADFPRVAFDHLLSIFGTLSPQTLAQIGKLKGATADEVVCHSNGCRIAEVMIYTGMLKAERLRILGGDNALMDIDYLNRVAAAGNLKEVTVFAVKNDYVTMVDPAWRIMERAVRLGPLATFSVGPLAADATYRLLGLAPHPPFNPTDRVNVHVCSNPDQSGGPPPGPLDPRWIQNHVYSTYDNLVNGLRLGGYLDAQGSMKREAFCR